MAKLRDLKARPRSIYRRNPLAEVIAAIKFPRQLALDERLPVDFQEAIKGDYPLLRLKNTFVVSMLLPAGENTPTPKQVHSKVYEFVSEDQKHQVTLLPDALALTTTAYSRWEEFQPRFLEVLEKVQDIYQLPLFTRVGLRYKDTIDRENLGLGDVPWDRLVNTDLLRPFAFFSADLDDYPAFTASVTVEIEAAQMRVNYGFVKDQQKKTGFLMDTDCYVDPAKIRTAADVASTLEGLHKYTSLAFGACITDELHTALQPTAV